MLGAGIALPFITMAAGVSFAILISGQTGMVWGGVIGFGVGCAILALVRLLFAIVKKWADG